MKIALKISNYFRDEKALFVCSHSAGKDSQAMYLFLKNLGIKNLVVIHADLGDVEWSGVQEHIKETISHELHVVRAEKTFFGMVEARGMWPSSKFRQCTSDLKTGPIYKEIRRLAKLGGYTTVINCTGIRAQESAARSKKEPFKVNAKLTTRDREVFDWMPIFKWTTEDVFGWIRKNGQKPHWAYEKGMSRLSCCFCIMANKADLKLSSQLNPELFEKTVALEKKIGHTMFTKKGKAIGLKEYVWDQK